jgi:DNA polymerase-4
MEPREHLTRPRKIIHVDMDAFYASVEQRDRPELRGRPLVVGGAPSTRGVVAACSYEARRFGVRSAMSSAQAERLCPEAIFVRPRMARYVEVSAQIREVFRSFTDQVEPLSLDEAYLDVTEFCSRADPRASTNQRGEPSAGKLARQIKQAIWERTGLVASAGVGPCKLVAKIASDLDKPDGFLVVAPEQVLAFLAPLPVTRLWGVGPATAARLSALGTRSIADVRRLSPELLLQRFGKYGAMLWRLAHGDDPRPVQPRARPKRRGSETTFAEDLLDLSALSQVLRDQCDEVAADLSRGALRARTVTLKLRYDDFTTITRSRSVERAFDDVDALYRLAHTLLLTATEAGRRPVRLIGVAAGTLRSASEPEQLCFDWSSDAPRI